MVDGSLGAFILQSSACYLPSYIFVTMSSVLYNTRKQRMKQTKTTKKRPSAAKRHTSVRARSSKRHIRITLHPVNLLFMLCVGVLLVASTLGTSAATSTYDVHATVPADPLADPAVITSVNDDDRFDEPALTVEGTCPVPSYVKVYQNSVLVGIANCTVTGFTIDVLLSAGANQLLVQDYNITDQIGPSSPSITVWYDAPIPPPTPPTGGDTSGGGGINVVPPASVQIMQVDNNVPYNPSGVPLTSQLPVFSGIATPFAKITLVIHSNPVTCRTTANANGYWRCAITELLPIGLHTVNVTAVAPSGKVIKVAAFQIRTIDEIPTGQAVTTGGPFSIATDYQYQAYIVGQFVPITLIISGGTAPYALTINWGDGTTSTLLRASTNASNIGHTYKWINASVGNYTIKIQGTDAAGHVSAVQLMTVIRNPGYHSPIATVVHYSGLTGVSMAVRAWLWLLWPAYIIIILMLLSFWLGERKQLDADKAKEKRRTTTKRRKPRTRRV